MYYSELTGLFPLNLVLYEQSVCDFSLVESTQLITYCNLQASFHTKARNLADLGVSVLVCR
jgi:hypothetical protein